MKKRKGKSLAGETFQDRKFSATESTKWRKWKPSLEAFYIFAKFLVDAHRDTFSKSWINRRREDQRFSRSLFLVANDTALDLCVSDQI